MRPIDLLGKTAYLQRFQGDTRTKCPGIDWKITGLNQATGRLTLHTSGAWKRSEIGLSMFMEYVRSGYITVE